MTTLRLDVYLHSVHSSSLRSCIKIKHFIVFIHAKIAILPPINSNSFHLPKASSDESDGGAVNRELPEPYASQTQTQTQTHAPADYGARVSNDLKLKGVLLDDRHKGVQVKQRRHKKLKRQHSDYQKTLLCRKKRKAILAKAYDSGPCLTHDSLATLREMWVNYAVETREAVGRLPDGFSATRDSRELQKVVGVLEFVKKFLRSLEYHGCELEVVEDDKVVVKGTVVGRGKNSLVLVTEKDKVVRLVSSGKLLRFQLEGRVYSFYGDQISP